MHLSTQEKIKLVLEAIVVSILTLFMIFALFQMLLFFFSRMPESIAEKPIVQEIISSATQPQSVYVEIFVMILIAVIVILTVLWRLSRRRRRFEMYHIIEGLVVIANGNYSYRIEDIQSEDLKEVVRSIHFLVDSTVEAMEEERRIEESKEELVTNASHDLRTPLTSIIGYLGLIESGQYKSEEELKKYVNIAYQKSLQMQSLVSDLFEYSQVSHGTAGFENSTFDLVQLMEQLVAEYELESNNQGIEIGIQSNRPAIYMKADSKKLVRVFTNIISNALKYGGDGDQIKITLEHRRSYVFIRIANNGRPISKKALDSIFERFYQAEKSRTDEQGAGLGLAIAKTIVEKQGGKISADVAGGWTHFDINLPLRSSVTNIEETQ